MYIFYLSIIPYFKEFDLLVNTSSNDIFSIQRKFCRINCNRMMKQTLSNLFRRFSRPNSHCLILSSRNDEFHIGRKISWTYNICMSFKNPNLLSTRCIPYYNWSILSGWDKQFTINWIFNRTYRINMANKRLTILLVLFIIPDRNHIFLMFEGNLWWLFRQCHDITTTTAGNPFVDIFFTGF